MLRRISVPSHFYQKMIHRSLHSDWAYYRLLSRYHYKKLTLMMFLAFFLLYSYWRQPDSRLPRPFVNSNYRLTELKRSYSLRRRGQCWFDFHQVKYNNVCCKFLNVFPMKIIWLIHWAFKIMKLGSFRQKKNGVPAQTEKIKNRKR